MLHPSYTELIKIVNGENEDHDAAAVNSRYSIVLATAKRARQIIDGQDPMSIPKVNKPLSIAVDEMRKGLLKVETEDISEDDEILTEEAVVESVLSDGVEKVTEEAAEETTEEM